MPEFDRHSDRYLETLQQAIAFSGDEASYFAEYKAIKLTELMDKNVFNKVLDFGCGIGSVSVAIQTTAPTWQINGFDISRDSLARVPSSLTEKGTFTSNIEDLGSDHDAVLLTGVMHHIHPEERRSALVLALDRLKPGGLLVVFEHNPWNPVTSWVVDRCPFDENAILLPPPEIVSIFQTIGLVNIKRRFIVFFPNITKFLRPLERWLTWCPLGAQYVIVGEKA